MLSDNDLIYYLTLSKTMEDEELRRITMMTDSEYKQFKAYRRRNTPPEEIRKAFFELLFGLSCFLCSTAGAAVIGSQFPGFGYAISLLLFILSGIYIFVLPGEVSSAHQKELRQKDYEYQKLKEVIHDAVWKCEITPLFPFCDLDFLRHVQRNSPFWPPERNLEEYEEPFDFSSEDTPQ